MRRELDACVKVKNLVITRALMGGVCAGDVLPAIFACLACIDGGRIGSNLR